MGEGIKNGKKKKEETQDPKEIISRVESECIAEINKVLQKHHCRLEAQLLISERGIRQVIQVVYIGV